MVTITAAGDLVLVSDAVGKEHLVPKNSKVIIKQSEKPLLLFY